MSDEHHQDPYAPIAFAYDMWTRSVVADAPWYEDLTSRVHGPGAHIVEVGAGSGRITRRLLRAGHELVAVEASAAMAARLMAHCIDEHESGLLTIISEDVVDVELPDASADLVIAPFRTLAHLETSTPAWFEHVRSWIAPGGVLAFDCAHLPEDLVHDSGWILREQGHVGTGDSRQLVLIEERLRRLGDEHAELSIRVSSDERVDQTTMSLWLPTPSRIHGLLRDAGYEIIEAHGGFHDEPLTHDAPDSVWVARPR